MQNGDAFIGRERELAQLERAIGPGDDGLRLVLLRGPSGLGKTTLSRVAISRIPDASFQVRVANGRAGSLSTPIAPWLEALPELGAEINDDTGQPNDIDHLGVALVDLLQEMAAERPLLLVFDDSQSLDESSIALLPYAAKVDEQTNLTIMFVEQTDAIDVSTSYRNLIDTIVAGRVVQQIDLGPMADESITELVRAGLDLAPGVDVPDEVVLRAQGNPWFAKELAVSFREGDSEVPVSIAAAATGRLHRLDDIAKDLVFALSLCPEGAHVRWLESLSDQTPDAFAATMSQIQASGVIREDGTFLAIAHPLMRQALLDELSAAMRRALHLELAESIDNVDVGEIIGARARAYHLNQAGKTDEAVRDYRIAAEANDTLGQLHEAFADYVRALESEPRIEQRVELLRLCAQRAVHISHPRAAEFWSELARIAATKRDNDLYAYALFQQYWTSHDGRSVDRLERAALLGPDEFGWSARAAATLRMLEGDYKAGIAHDVRALELARETGDGRLETLALERAGAAYALVGDLPNSIAFLTEAVSLATEQRFHDWAITAWASLTEVLTYNLEVDRALEECRASLQYAQDLRLDRYKALLLTMYARCLLRRGMLDDARATAEEALVIEKRFPHDRYSAYIAVSRAEVAVEVDGPMVANVAVEEAFQLAEDLGFQSFIFDALLERGKLLTRTGRIPEAVELASSLEIDEPEMMATLALWFLRTGMHYRDDASLQLALRVADELDGGPLVQLISAEVDSARLEDGPDKVAAIRAIADRWHAASRPLDSLRALASMGMVQLALGQVPEAIETFTKARAGFSACGASHDADFVAGQLRALGMRSRASSRSTTVGNLTKRELEIARLVATGKRNAEVAAQLFLAEKTVAAHLSNIYGKLEVRSRVHLSAWLKDHDDADVSVAS